MGVTLVKAFLDNIDHATPSSLGCTQDYVLEASTPSTLLTRIMSEHSPTLISKHNRSPQSQRKRCLFTHLASPSSRNTIEGNDNVALPSQHYYLDKPPARKVWKGKRHVGRQRRKGGKSMSNQFPLRASPSYNSSSEKQRSQKCNFTKLFLSSHRRTVLLQEVSRQNIEHSKLRYIFQILKETVCQLAAPTKCPSRASLILTLAADADQFRPFRCKVCKEIPWSYPRLNRKGQQGPEVLA